MEEIILADVILHALNDKKEAKISELVKATGFSEENIRSAIKYLKKRECVKSPLFVTFISSTDPIPEGNYSLSTRGKEIILSGMSFQDIIKSELQGNSSIVNNTSIQGHQNQVAQSGNDSKIAQTQENIEHYILEKVIEDDDDLLPEQKSEMKKVVNKIKELVSTGETGEKIYEYVKRGIGICSKYAPILWGLVKSLA